MAGSSSPDPPLADRGLLEYSSGLHESHSKRPSPKTSRQNDTSLVRSPFSAESEPGFLSQLGSSTTTNTSRDADSQCHIDRAAERGPKSPFYPAENEQAFETTESFSFAPQPKHKPNQFSGLQKQRNIDFEALEAPATANWSPSVDRANPDHDNPRLVQEQAALMNNLDHHRDVSGTQTGDSARRRHQETNDQSISDAQGPNTARSELDHVENQAEMTTHPTFGRADEKYEPYPTEDQTSRPLGNIVSRRLKATMGCDLVSRPFADADAILPVAHQLSPHVSRGTSELDNYMTCHSNHREGIDGTARRPQATGRRMEITSPKKMSRPSDCNTVNRSSREHRQHASIHNKRQLEPAETRSRTPVGDLEMPQTRTPTTGHNQRRVSPREQPTRPFSHEEQSDVVPRRTISRQSNISRHRRSRHHQERQSQSSRGELPIKNQAGHQPGQTAYGQSRVQKSHFDVLKSIITHHNMFLEDAKLTEANLKCEIAGQEQHIEALGARLESSHLQYRQEQDRREALESELGFLQQEKDKIAAIAAKSSDRTQELENEVSKLQAQAEQHNTVTIRLENELVETKSKLSKLQEKSRGYKDYLNKAVIEQQKLWQQSKDVSQKAIDDMRKENQEFEEKLRLALKKNQEVQDDLDHKLDDRRTALRQELNAAVTSIKSLESAMKKLEDDLNAESIRTKDCEDQLRESRHQETLLMRVEESIERISDKMDRMNVLPEHSNSVPTSVTERLEVIVGYVQSAPRADVEDEIRQALRAFQAEMMSQFFQGVKGMMAGQSIIKDKLQSLENNIQQQSTSAQTDRREQQEKLLEQHSHKIETNEGLLQLLQSKEAQVVEMTTTVAELTQELQQIRASAELAFKSTMASEAGLQILHERLSDREHQIAEIQAQFQVQRESRETTLAKPRERLRHAEEDVSQKSELVKDSHSKMATAKNEFAAMAQEKQRELKLQLRHSEDSRQILQQQLSESEVEIKRLKALEYGSGELRLQKELDNAHQRITNLTLKLRETQTPAVDAEVLDQLADQLSQLHRMKDEIKQLKTSGKTYTMVSKELVAMLHGQDAAGSDTILAPDSLVVPEMDLPELPHDVSNDPLVNHVSSSSEPSPVQSGKRTVFRSPVEEPDCDAPAPSVVQEKFQRKEATSQGPQPKPILRQKRMAPGSSNAHRMPLVTRHAGHSSYNRPVQGASRTSEAAISDVRSNLVGNRQAQVSELTGHDDWQRMTAKGSQDGQQGAKRSRSVSVSLSFRRQKRSKPSFPIDEDAEASAAGGSSGLDPLKVELSQQQGDEGNTHASQEQPQDQDHTSRHFHQSMSK
ncbi:hypothetical protein CTA2_8567 [Colletotrichum tanaceti]|uniref:Uncharacterized protein n=1 Tax=Colletotrichum tanaceti TaxID=1306861 RepID=A0A4U6XRV5_9PEZI|nr:hypothetical protein CTA2_8567 [Colletotrichum tanaceti]TKW58558.1 hypothetical protein CTA1_6476 [Colletotrichum tanaceti]